LFEGFFEFLLAALVFGGPLGEVRQLQRNGLARFGRGLFEGFRKLPDGPKDGCCAWRPALRRASSVTGRGLSGEK
jgi:hypothetical protein